MSDQSRVAKVLAALLVSMTTGAVVLMALGNNPPSAGAFCLQAIIVLARLKKRFPRGPVNRPIVGTGLKSTTVVLEQAM